MAKIHFLIFIALFLSSCEKYRGYDNMEVLDNSFTGIISVSDLVGDVEGSYTGADDSGTYTFIWDNPSRGALLNIDTVSAGSGTMQFSLRDARGDEVLNETLNASEVNAFSKDGKKGKWKVKITFSGYEGEGRFDLNPIN